MSNRTTDAARIELSPIQFKQNDDISKIIDRESSVFQDNQDLVYKDFKIRNDVKFLNKNFS